MAYLHCHACGWEQDDFWTWRYNPLTKLWDDVKWLARPRIMEMDSWIVEELTEYTGVHVWRFKHKEKSEDSKKDWKNDDKVIVNLNKHSCARVFSWDWLFLEAVKEWKLFRRQKWWTMKSWKKHRDTAVCPKCGQRAFDID